MSHDKYFDGFSITESVLDYEFTRDAIMSINRIYDSKDFAQMDAEEIFRYLSKEIRIVVFKDHLKRFVYEISGIKLPFAAVTDEMYQQIIMDSFERNHAPFHFEPSSTRPSAIIKRWLRQASATRDTIFILGFGFAMNDKEVAKLLQKTLLEETFNFTNPRECIFWYCYHNNKPYAKAKYYLAQYEELQEVETFSNSLWKLMKSNPTAYMIGERELMMYLKYLKAHNSEHSAISAMDIEFHELYKRACKVANDILYKGQNDEISAADLERILCSGIPMTEKGNLMKVSDSSLGGLFDNKRMTRQRINCILSGSRHADRFDLLTLLFMIYAEEVEPGWPSERYLRFIDEANQILNKCGMMDLYPVNPYEACLLMCELKEYPLDAYAEIWEKSYE